jgi:hypothetical protein
MREDRNEYVVREMAGIFGVSSNACYRRAKYGVSGRRREADAELTSLIRRMQEWHHYRYERPRLRKYPRRDYGSG